MALWQFDVALIPHCTGPTFDVDGYNVRCFSRDLTGLVVEFLNEEFRGQPRQQGEERVSYGHEKGNRVDLYFEGEEACIFARVDMRAPQAMLGLICKIAEDLNCAIYIPETRVIAEPLLEVLKVHAANSRAASFAIDPVAALHLVASKAN
jgi:hypothetical protein